MDPLFQVHKLNAKGFEKAGRLADVFDHALREVVALDPASGRELALVRTHLELACFYSKKAIATQPENQHLEG